MKITSFFMAFCFTPLLSAQPSIEWQKALGGSDFDEARNIKQTSDGGYIITGTTYSNDGDVLGFHGIVDFWIVKLSSSGSIQWQKTLGGSHYDWPYSIRETLDKGFVVVGYSESTDGDVSGNHGDRDAWVVKINDTGNIEWQKSLGGSGWDEARSIELSSDGGYIMAGRSNSNDGDVSGNHSGSLDYWVVKLDSAGIIKWQKSLGGSEEDTAHSIRQTSDGGFIVVGEAQSNDGDVSLNNGNVDFWIVKLNNAGEILWQKALGGSGWDAARDIHETSDGYVTWGLTGSNDGDVTGHQGIFDFWIVKLNKIGDLIWQKTLGGSNADWLYAGSPTIDSGYVIAGPTRSTDGDVLNNTGGQDIWIVRLDQSGAVEWQKTIGGSKSESCYAIQQTSDNGYILAGFSWSNDGDVSGVHGNDDFWIVKLSPESVNTTEAPNPKIASLQISPNPASQSIRLKTESETPIQYVVIFDLLGREVLKESRPNIAEMDISGLPPGFYLLVASDDSGMTFSGKVVKE